MNHLGICPEQVKFMLPLIIIAAIWDITWKAIGMWKAARNGELAWFICIAIFNTIGILPIIYIFLDKQKKSKVE